ncbi:four-carbon acid sugar kinase family protein [Nonomuraea sp. NPDC049709]|uniref:four-carbon acid sugar kinase family protein n=1 Tax=Nonomuraea sp. NPDC049709 TaxID=3154736 RepID=UPI00342F2D60
MAEGSVFALADDLSGAAETAALLMPSGGAARIALSGPPYPVGPPVLVADLDSRHHPRAGDLVREALRHAAGRRVFVKIDSLLRGNVAATAAACLDAPAVLVPALPAAGRTVVGGVPYVHGVPLRETRAWHAERRPAPASVAEALGATPSTLVPLATVRAGHAALTRALGKAAGRVAVCDAQTDDDLDAIVAAALEAGPGTRLIGAGGLAAALGRTSPIGTPAPLDPPPSSRRPPGGMPLLVVVGTADPGAATQARLLTEHGAATPVPLSTSDLSTPRAAARRVRAALATAPTVLTVTVTGPPPPALTSSLGRIVADALAGRPANLVLTGGETARRVLDALTVQELRPMAQIHHGAVLSHTAQGHTVVTRPGSFGDRDSLLRIVTHLSDPEPERLT